jgi:phage tail-like protein
MTTDTEYPLTLFRFQVDFKRVSLSDHKEQGEMPLCRGAFSDCSGLEATMEPKVIKAGGWNYGARQRPGPVTFGTVILKRGMTTTRDLWKWFSQVSELGKFAFRLNVTIRVSGPGEDIPGKTVVVQLLRALPLKFKCADLSARGTEVSVEELHLAHEGMVIETKS